MKKIIIAVVFVAVVGVGVFVLFTKKGSTPAPATGQTPSLQATSSNPNQPVAATITYTDNGFSPSKTTVKAGDVVRVVNNSSSPMQFSSDPHPVHTADEELNQTTTSPGASQDFTVTKKGTFGFHDHLMPNHTGTIVVE